MIHKITEEIKSYLRTSAPQLTKEQKTRMYKILNSNNPRFIAYGNKHSEIEKFVRRLHSEFDLSYDNASQIFKRLIKSNIHDEKIAGLFLLNRFKKDFNEETVDMIQEVIPGYFDSWAITDTTMIRVVGPYLAKSGNEKLAEKTIKEWSKSEFLWVRRAALVILLKIIMVLRITIIQQRKEFIMVRMISEMIQLE